MTTEAEVHAALAGVNDPELPVSVVDLGLIRGIAIDGEEVVVRMTFTSIACPCTELLRDDVGAAVLALDGVERARVEEVFETWTRHDMTEEGRTILRALAIV